MKWRNGSVQSCFCGGAHCSGGAHLCRLHYFESFAIDFSKLSTLWCWQLLCCNILEIEFCGDGTLV